MVDAQMTSIYPFKRICQWQHNQRRESPCTHSYNAPRLLQIAPVCASCCSCLRERQRSATSRHASVSHSPASRLTWHACARSVSCLWLVSDVSTSIVLTLDVSKPC